MPSSTALMMRSAESGRRSKPVTRRSRRSSLMWSPADSTRGGADADVASCSSSPTVSVTSPPSSPRATVRTSASSIPVHSSRRGSVSRNTSTPSVHECRDSPCTTDAYTSGCSATRNCFARSTSSSVYALSLTHGSRSRPMSRCSPTSCATAAHSPCLPWCANRTPSSSVRSARGTLYPSSGGNASRHPRRSSAKAAAASARVQSSGSARGTWLRSVAATRMAASVSPARASDLTAARTLCSACFRCRRYTRRRQSSSVSSPPPPPPPPPDADVVERLSMKVGESPIEDTSPAADAASSTLVGSSHALAVKAQPMPGDRVASDHTAKDGGRRRFSSFVAPESPVAASSSACAGLHATPASGPSACGTASTGPVPPDMRRSHILMSPASDAVASTCPSSGDSAACRTTPGCDARHGGSPGARTSTSVAPPVALPVATRSLDAAGARLAHSTVPDDTRRCRVAAPASASHTHSFVVCAPTTLAPAPTCTAGTQLLCVYAPAAVEWLRLSRCFGTTSTPAADASSTSGACRKTKTRPSELPSASADAAHAADVEGNGTGTSAAARRCPSAPSCTRDSAFAAEAPPRAVASTASLPLGCAAKTRLSASCSARLRVQRAGHAASSPPRPRMSDARHEPSSTLPPPPPPLPAAPMPPLVSALLRDMSRLYLPTPPPPPPP
eukprot:Rhum_TRINITY_DN14524_c20_g1::Rhum_TRINITY_DN14524_c20_g1_i1::g.96745::m.96745